MLKNILLWGSRDSLSPHSQMMAKPSKRRFLTLLKLALLGVSLPLAVSSQSWVRAATVRHSSPEYAQAAESPTAQPTQPPAAKSPPAKPHTPKPQPSPTATAKPAHPPKPQPTPTAKAKPALPPKAQPTQPAAAKKTSHKQNKQPDWRLIATLAVAMGAASYQGSLRFRPLWLLELPSGLKIPKIPGLIPTEITLPIPALLFLKYRPRVLDAWVAERIDSARKQFEIKQTVKERQIHIAMPVYMDGKELQSLTAKDLQEAFTAQEIRLLICGEGGAGKTSLACQIAQWAMAENKADRLGAHLMIPVLIEEELEKPAQGKSPLLEAIARELKHLRDEEKPVSEELVKQLLKHRRILVIADRLSEMSETTRQAIALKDRNLPVSALAVTSRVEGILGKDVSPTTLKPQPVSSGSLLVFMDAYLTRRGKRSLFRDDIQYIEDFKRLSQIVPDDRDVTLLFAKLYLELMIAAAGRRTDNLPANVPDLVISYTNKLNQNARYGAPDTASAEQGLKVVAWKCLQQNFQPETADRQEAIAALAALRGGEGEAEKFLTYLEKDLGLIRTQFDSGSIRFTTDTLAEYLAGLYLVEDCKDSRQKWRNFLAEAESKSGFLEEIKGFLLAVRDCCLTHGSKKVPDFVAEELGNLAGLDLDALKPAPEKRHIQRLISELSVPEVEDRRRAAEEIAKMGSHAQLAASALVSALTDEDSQVRWSAAQALLKLGSATEPVLGALQGLLADSNSWVRLNAAEALVKLGQATEPVLGALQGLLADSNSWVRLNAAQALVKLSQATEPVRQGLLGLLADSNARVRSSAAQLLGELGSATEPVVLGLQKLLADSNSGVRLNAAEALVKLGQATEPVRQGLQKLLADEDFSVRRRAEEALAKLSHSREPV
ncbi:HEAT repeat domain-containing protein [Kamptonema formosum]|uniref:HEAT repeat domain-containing protein n=2 Tax=Kamptonema formosum TaxID=331992 RepID=UPI000345BF4B|nr:HEAT repeat domain-containing protein [Oscillatoria sp. PCC 10802]